MVGSEQIGLVPRSGWALHPLWDAGLHDHSTQFVPHWYIGACIGFDLLVAVYLASRKLNFNGRNLDTEPS